MAAKKSRCKFGKKKGTNRCRKTRAPRRHTYVTRGRKARVFSRGRRAGSGTYKVTCNGKRVYATDSRDQAMAAASAAKRRMGGRCLVFTSKGRVAQLGRYR